jgi:hypothetical protein
VTVSCDNYCTTITANCTGTNAQYASKDHCNKVCAFFTLGTAADTANDTVGCRQYHAGAAAGAPATHCPHAGPYGGDGIKGEQCVPAGDTGQTAACDTFCEIMQGNCKGGAQQFADVAACKTACGAWANKATETYGEQAPQSSTVGSADSFNCRSYHLMAASTGVAGVAATHCPHAGAAVSAVCP